MLTVRQRAMLATVAPEEPPNNSSDCQLVKLNQQNYAKLRILLARNQDVANIFVGLPTQILDFTNKKNDLESFG